MTEVNSRKMVKPVLLTVDDDREVSRAIERDLRRKYASDFRVLRAESGQAAMEIVQELKIRNSPVALFLVDQPSSLSLTVFAY